MLIPAINRNPRLCTAVPDKHVVKLIAEQLQLASTALRKLQPGRHEPLLLRSTHAHHPYTLWTAQSLAHVVYVLRIAQALCQEKLRRWPRNAPHIYAGRVDALLLALDADARFAAALPECEMPIVCASEAMVPDAHQRAAILQAAVTDRAAAFRLYFWFVKRPQQTLWHFGGAEETAARKRRRTDPEDWLPAVWATRPVPVSDAHDDVSD